MASEQLLAELLAEFKAFKQEVMLEIGEMKMEIGEMNVTTNQTHVLVNSRMSKFLETVQRLAEASEEVAVNKAEKRGAQRERKREAGEGSPPES